MHKHLSLAYAKPRDKAFGFGSKLLVTGVRQPICTPQIPTCHQRTPADLHHANSDLSPAYARDKGETPAMLARPVRLSRIDDELARAAAKLRGLSFSEYVRTLIRRDLETAS